MQENKARVTTENGMKNSFGFKNITPEEKQYKVNQVFHSVADKYDLMNSHMVYRQPEVKDHFHLIIDND